MGNNVEVVKKYSRSYIEAKGGWLNGDHLTNLVLHAIAIKETSKEHTKWYKKTRDSSQQYKHIYGS